MAINWTAMTDLVTNAMALITTMVEAVPAIIVPLFAVIILLLVLKFGRGLIDGIVGLLKIKF